MIVQRAARRRAIAGLNAELLTAQDLNRHPQFYFHVLLNAASPRFVVSEKLGWLNLTSFLRFLLKARHLRKEQSSRRRCLAPND